MRRQCGHAEASAGGQEAATIELTHRELLETNRVYPNYLRGMPDYKRLLVPMDGNLGQPNRTRSLIAKKFLLAHRKRIQKRIISTQAQTPLSFIKMRFSRCRTPHPHKRICRLTPSDWV